MTDSTFVDTLLTDTTTVDSLIILGDSENGSFGWTLLLLFIGVIIAISAIGFFILRTRIKEINAKKKHTQMYQKQLTTFLESEGEDMNAYSWLVDRSVKMQRMMGEFGKITYIAPYQRYKVNNQEIVINFVPQIKKEFENVLNKIAPSFEMISFYANSLQEALIRFRGVLSDELEEVHNNMRKPHYWFILGMRQILSFPVYLLAIFGLLKISMANSFRDSIFVKIISFIVVLIGIVGSIFTIVLGWNNFWKIVQKHL